MRGITALLLLARLRLVAAAADVCHVLCTTSLARV
jgi:hypothetical protein